jgi:hypothetical protein
MYLVQGFCIECQSSFPLRGHITQVRRRGNDKGTTAAALLLHANMRAQWPVYKCAKSLRSVERALYWDRGQRLREPKEEVCTDTLALANRVADLLDRG